MEIPNKLALKFLSIDQAFVVNTGKMRTLKFHWIIGFAAMLGIVLVFFWVWNSANTESKGELAQETRVQFENGLKDILDPLDKQSGESTDVKPSMGTHQAFNAPSNAHRSIDDPTSQETRKNQPLSTELDDAIQLESHMMDLNARKPSVEENAGDDKHLGEYIDPDSEDYFSLETPGPAEHLGEYIDPDEEVLLIEENAAEIKHVGEYIDPDVEEAFIEENPVEDQHLGDYIDPESSYVPIE